MQRWYHTPERRAKVVEAQIASVEASRADLLRQVREHDERIAKAKAELESLRAASAPAPAPTSELVPSTRMVTQADLATTSEPAAVPDPTPTAPALPVTEDPEIAAIAEAPDAPQDTPDETKGKKRKQKS